MKYMLLAYTGVADWSQIDVASPQFQAVCEFYEQLGRELTESGELVATEGLADPALTKTIRKRAGEMVAVDGPFAETKEILVSFAIVDCVSHDRAMAIATRVVNTVGDTVEVRPILSGPPGA